MEVCHPTRALGDAEAAAQGVWGGVQQRPQQALPLRTGGAVRGDFVVVGQQPTLEQSLTGSVCVRVLTGCVLNVSVYVQVQEFLQSEQFSCKTSGRTKCKPQRGIIINAGGPQLVSSAIVSIKVGRPKDWLGWQGVWGGGGGEGGDGEGVMLIGVLVAACVCVWGGYIGGRRDAFVQICDQLHPCSYKPRFPVSCWRMCHRPRGE